MPLKNFLARVAQGLAFIMLVLGMMGASALAEESMQPVLLLHINENKVTGVEGPIRINQGDTVTLRWHVGTRTKLHLHGYDIRAVIEPDTPYDMLVTAHATGRFPITTHGAGGEHVVLQYLEVYPR